LTEPDDKHQDKVKSSTKFFQKLKENWVWVNIGGIIVNTVFLWVLYFFEITGLGFTIGFTLFYPLMIILAVLIKKAKNPRLLYKIIFIGCFGYLIGLIFWLFLSYLLINAPWAPFSDVIIGKTRIWIHIFTLFLFSALSMLLLYLIGKKKGWKYQPVV
jgi:hypothetical protein